VDGSGIKGPAVFRRAAEAANGPISPGRNTISRETFLTTRVNAHATVRRADNRPGGNLRTRVSRGPAFN